MKKTTTLILVVFGLLTNTITAQTVSIDGFALFENQSIHDSIKVLFVQTAPGSLFDSTFTDSTGYYSKQFDSGIYDITFVRDGYSTVFLSGQVLYSNQTIDTVILEKTDLSGQLSGILNAGDYIVGTNIEVSQNDTLVIEPGVRLLFKQDIQFDIYGLLLAEGNEQNNIEFTIYSSEIRWNGIHLDHANNNSIISFAIVEYSKNGGIGIEFCNPTIKNSEIRFNSNSNYQGGGITSIEGSPILLNLRIMFNSCNFYGGGIFMRYAPGNPCIIPPQITNCIICNNYSGNYGGGISFREHIYPILTNVVISNNSSGNGTGGITQANYCNCTYVNCVISDNLGAGITMSGNDSASMINCNYWNNQNSLNIEFNNNGVVNDWVGINVTINANGDSCDIYRNIQKPPLFVDTTNQNYYLQTSSPCIDAGKNAYVNTQTDIDGFIRIWDGNYDGDTIVDIGAYEFDAPIYTTIDNFYTDSRNFVYNIYPNPSRGLFKIEINNKDKLVVEIYNINGQLLYRKKLNNTYSKQIDITSYSKGIYFVKLHCEEFVRIEKIVKY